MKKLFIIFIFNTLLLLTYSQSAYISFDEDYYYLLERYEVMSGRMSNDVHFSNKMFERRQVVQFLMNLELDSSELSKADKFNLKYLKNDNWELISEEFGDSRKPILKHFYQKQNSFIHYYDEKFDVQINPVLSVFIGFERNVEHHLYRNSRGIEARGSIGKRIGFYTHVTDNLQGLPSHVWAYIDRSEALPYQGPWKPFRNNGVDYFFARGHITFDVIKDLVNVQFGHDRNIVGNGFRSLLMSDFTNNYLFLKINTRVWKFNYSNLFAEMAADYVGIGTTTYRKKFLAQHHLSTNIGKKLNVGVYEAIIYPRESDLGLRPFELNYANPIIFYKAIENQLGSPDKATIGLDARWNITKSISLYGQLVVNEFSLNELRAGEGWWGNKQAGQLGLKYFNVAGVKNFDIQGEMNIVRPYLYTDKVPEGSSSSFQLPLAHPLGANFYEIIGIMRYQPIPRLRLNVTGMYVIQGLDGDNTNWGSNIMLPYTTREQEYGNFIGQGIRSNTVLVNFTASYMLRHNFFIDLNVMNRTQSTDEEIPAYNFNTRFVTAGIRWNFTAPRYIF